MSYFQYMLNFRHCTSSLKLENPACIIMPKICSVVGLVGLELRYSGIGLLFCGVHKSVTLVGV